MAHQMGAGCKESRYAVLSQSSRKRQTHRGCTSFGSAGTQRALALAQEQMKSQKQAQNQGLQLGTGQGQAQRMEDLVTSMEQGRWELARGGGGPEISCGAGGQQEGGHLVGGPSHLCWTMAPGPPREVQEAP